MKAENFLVEIGTEELPPKSLTKFTDSLEKSITQHLQTLGLSFTHITTYATPRRIAAHIHQLAPKQANKHVEKRGPATQAAYDANGTPTKACEGFLRSCNATASQLTQRDGYVWLTVHEQGKTVAELMPIVIQQAIQQLPIAKRMRWGNYDAEFVRPVHWIVMLYGADILPATVLDHPTGRNTFGHRFHHPKALALSHADKYEHTLEGAYVIPTFAKRREQIKNQIIALAHEVKGQIVMNTELLDEVTALVEWPIALRGEFDRRFLNVPQEALISAMQGHQKSFAVVDVHHQLMPYFITVSNIESKDAQRVITGNQRVMHARLSDAAFFYTTDLKQPLQHYIDRLKTVVFQTQLGTLYDKTSRIRQLVKSMVTPADLPLAERAAELCKMDLMTNIVGEFPELQGIAGYYYAKQANEPAEVALAIKEHYLPRFAGDELPTTPAGCAVAIADRVDTLVGIFGISQIPTGEKDPFGLRRAALGILRIIIEHELSLDLHALIITAQANYANLSNKDTVNDVFSFVMERLRAWYADRQIPVDVFNAVLAVQPTKPLDFHYRINAVSQFVQLPEAAALAAANKRVSRILEKEGLNGAAARAINPALFEHDEERTLAAALTEKAAILKKSHDYVASLNSLATLRTPIDQFFDNVMVMVDNPAQRENRLAMLQQLRTLFLTVADISLLPSA